MATKTKKVATKRAATRKGATKKGATKKTVTRARRPARTATKAAKSPRKSTTTTGAMPIVGRGNAALMIGGVEYRFNDVDELREILEVLRASLAELHTAVTAALSMIDTPADARVVIDEEIDVIVPGGGD